MKFTCQEYGIGVGLSDLENHFPSLDILTESVEKANKRLRQSLGIKRDVIALKDGQLQAFGIAGAFKLSPNVQINVVPKFFGDTSDSSWMPTLFLLSSLSKFGNILTRDQVYSSTSYLGSLYQVAARILADEFLKNCHRPIRQYRKDHFNEFPIEGELEFDSLFEKNPDGYEQTSVQFDRRNVYNATIKKAMEVVLPYTEDDRVMNVLKEGIASFGPQVSFLGHKENLPSRNREWGPAYDLAFNVVNGMGSNFDLGQFESSGFAVDTWRLWEWLLTVSIKKGKQKEFVYPQQPVNFGYKTIGQTNIKINVYPDIVVYSKKGDSKPYLLIDAKYKTTPFETRGSID